MPLTPIDVQQKTFRVALRGYAEDEVDEFLDEVVLSVREYEQRLEEMSFQVGTLESQLSENRQTEDAMRRTLLLAEKTAGEITEEAQREAERIVSDARAEATSLTSEQSEERDALIQELGRLRQIVADVQDRLRDLASDTDRRLAPVANEIDDALSGLRPVPEPVDQDSGLAAVPDDGDDAWPDQGAAVDEGAAAGEPAADQQETDDEEPGAREHRFWGAPARDQDLQEAAPQSEGSEAGSVLQGGFIPEDSGPDATSVDSAVIDVDSPEDGLSDSAEDSAREAHEEVGRAWPAEPEARGGFLPDADRSEVDRSDLDAANGDDASASDDGAQSTEAPAGEDGPEDAGRRRPWERFSD
jgi:cell division initiation protein